jgi:Alw26I/Eco31I/Esp3I family type II restriction m6 adenine DNA methyltransferase
MAVKTYEMIKLASVETKLTEVSGSNHEFRLQILEAVSSLIGGFDLKSYFLHYKVKENIALDKLLSIAHCILISIKETKIPLNLAISALSHEPLTIQKKKSAGSYYTDFRIAQFLSQVPTNKLSENSKVIDPACGNGILLAATVQSICSDDQIKIKKLLENNLYACDISPIALRTCRIVLSSFLNELSSIVKMTSNWRVQDTLIADEFFWRDLSKQKFDFVIANPPWEKIKLTKHEYQKDIGIERHYGEEHSNFCTKSFNDSKNKLAQYSKLINIRFPSLGKGEVDMYMPFLHLLNSLAKIGGIVSFLVPAGLIRSQGTENLRKLLFQKSKNLQITIFDNKSKFFSIDTRFKFVAVAYEVKNESQLKTPEIRIQYGSVIHENIEKINQVNLELNELKECRSDLTIPEVKSIQEWNIFKKINSVGIDWCSKSSSWFPSIQREVDMTNMKRHFRDHVGAGSIPVIEGRMVNNYRIGAKSYVSGTGRKALWVTNKLGHAEIKPQFYILKDNLSVDICSRAFQERVGFCDIAGQTNERAMMSTVIPSGLVAGNKVPTITFKNTENEDLKYVWVGITNSFVFDWAIRRIITTTINLFLLKSIKLPPIKKESSLFEEVALLVKSIITIDSSSKKVCFWKVAEQKARIDLIILIEYGLGYLDLLKIMEDFPLLDRGQPSILGESNSTVTTDLLLYKAAIYFNQPYEILENRVKLAKEAGAFPYLSSELAKA